MSVASIATLRNCDLTLRPAVVESEIVRSFARGSGFISVLAYFT